MSSHSQKEKSESVWHAPFWMNENFELSSTSTAFDSTVEVVVDRRAKKFTVHKPVLANSAPFFKAALEGDCVEATEQTIEMLDVSSEVFQRFMLWMYTTSLIGDGEDARDLSCEVLVRLYIFGDSYGISNLQNCAMDTLKTRLDLSIARLGRRNTSLIYKNTIKGCSLRRFAVERAAFRGAINDLFDTEAHMRELPSAFSFDLIRLLNDVKDGKVEAIKENEWKNIGCRYHVHPTDETNIATT